MENRKAPWVRGWAEIKGKSDYSRNFNKSNLRPPLVKFTHHHMTFSNDFICCKVKSVSGAKNIQQPGNGYCLKVLFLIDGDRLVDGS